MLDTWAPDQDESERGVTCSVRSAACPGPSVVRWNWTSLRTACWMFAGRLGPGPMYTWGVSDPVQLPTFPRLAARSLACHSHRSRGAPEPPSENYGRPRPPTFRFPGVAYPKS